MANSLLVGGGIAAAIGSYFTYKSLTRPHRTDEQNFAIASQKFNNALTDTLAQPGLGLAANFNDPATAAFLNSSQGLGLLGGIYAGQVTDNRGNTLSNNDRQWLATAAARNDGNALAFLRPVQYAYNTAPYQPFGNYTYGTYDPYNYSNTYGNSGYGNYFGNSGYGLSNPNAFYQGNTSFYGSPYSGFTGQSPNGVYY